MKMETTSSVDADKDPLQKSKSRKPRKRMKNVYSKIREQMEFYFSDANLYMSKFMKETLAEAKDGYVDLNLFLTFNKIKSLTQDTSVLAAALDRQSKLLEINDAKTHVRRVTPYMDPVDIDDRTVYVECLPPHVDHDWIKKVFSPCGLISYISLPKYATTWDLKGFAFVTFETVEQAEMACKELHNPPADATSPVGMFPKSSTQLEAIKKKLPEEQIRASEEKAKELVKSAETVEPEVETETKDDTKTPMDKIDGNSEIKSPTKVSGLKRARVASESSVDGSAGLSDPCPTPTKRKRSDAASDSQDTSKAVKTEKPVAQGKKKSRKRKSQSKCTDASGAEGDTKDSENDLNKSAEAVPSKIMKIEKVEETQDKVQVEKEEETQDKDINDGSENESSAKTNENVKEGSKKRRHRNKKPKREKELPELKVIPKKDWLILKEEYLKLQKTSMTIMKKTLMKQSNTIDDKGKKNELEFIADVIVKVSSQDPMTRKHLKECLGEKHKIAYIDVKDDHYDGHIRCKDSQSAHNIASTSLPGYTFSLLTGDEEQQYWTKAINDRQTKLQATSKTRTKKRGQQKWMDKAQKASIENSNRKHIVFDED